MATDPELTEARERCERLAAAIENTRISPMPVGPIWKEQDDSLRKDAAAIRRVLAALPPEPSPTLREAVERLSNLKCKICEDLDEPEFSLHKAACPVVDTHAVLAQFAAVLARHAAEVAELRERNTQLEGRILLTATHAASPLLDELAKVRAENQELQERLRKAIGLLKDHGVGVAADGAEYCVYCDWPFGKPYPSDGAEPANHRPDCILKEEKP
jgi:FtsZ-binding cell division protein ZapB